mmetsp:Transcript_22478/g.54927  ORF Transcript_22478/g.54927 Transcript_22478/m.54927 type:complete len:217 (+) Transcript_22478:2-652(+)
MKSMLTEQPTWDSVDNWVAWFAVFAGVLREFFKIEELILYPWVGTKMLTSGPLNTRSRSKEKFRVVGWLDRIEKLAATIGSSTLVESMRELVELINELCQWLLRYFELKEKQLPKRIRQARTEAECENAKTRMTKAALVSEYGTDAVALLSRALSKEQQKRFKRDHLPTSGVLNASGYPQWVYSFATRHIARARPEAGDATPPRSRSRLLPWQRSR